jgi:PAS domain S-box-containing protein
MTTTLNSPPRWHDTLDGILASAAWQSKDAMMLTEARLDAPGPLILQVNPAFERLTGYSAAELVGQTPRMLQGPRTKRSVLDKIRRRLEAGRSVKASTWNYRKDGTPFLMEWTMSPVFDSDGHIEFFFAVQRDITHLYRKHKAHLDRQNALMQRMMVIQEEERNRIARDLHDSLGQKLSVARIMLNLQLHNQGDKLAPELVNGLEQLGQFIDESIQEMRNLSRALTPRLLQTEGLTYALNHLCESVTKTTEVQFTFEPCPELENLEAEPALLLYRIVQEWVNNTLKHAQATSIELMCSRHSPQHLQLRYRDNGKGMEISGVQHAASGLGTRSIQERVQLLKGQLELNSQPGKGVEYILTFRGS